ncbi:hypothetical protein [Acaryochloris thomasi]|uniref:hypothetical protein n=1 Tax=Acaryochloris thomasi TaxID=2929456 RepID=UPI000DA6A099|nr:hypothetical protein [Acaryochloris thomasi]
MSVNRGFQDFILCLTAIWYRCYGKAYKSDAQRMRAENAQARLAAKRKAERDQQMRDAISRVPVKHRI